MKPLECINMDEIRSEIDRLDKKIVSLIGNRSQYVRVAARFKKSEAGVKAPKRFESMLMQRRKWAQESGLDPDIIEKLFSDLVNHFIAEELKEWQK